MVWSWGCPCIVGDIDDAGLNVVMSPKEIEVEIEAEVGVDCEGKTGMGGDAAQMSGVSQI